MQHFIDIFNQLEMRFMESYGSELHITLILTWAFWMDWLIDYLRFYVPLKNISLVWRRHHCRWRAAKFRPMLGAQGLWAGRDLYRATSAETRDLGFFGLIRRTSPLSRLLWHTRGCGGSILTRILTGMMDANGNCLPCYIRIVGNCLLKIRIWIKLLPSRHAMLNERWIDVELTSKPKFNVVSTCCVCWVRKKYIS